MSVHFQDFPQVAIGARKPKESLRDRWHHWRLERQYLAHVDEAEQYAYIDGVKFVVKEPPRLNRRNWLVAAIGTGEQKRVTSTQISRVTGSLEDSGLGK